MTPSPCPDCAQPLTDVRVTVSGICATHGVVAAKAIRKLLAHDSLTVAEAELAWSVVEEMEWPTSGDEVHSIPVPNGWSAEQAWEAIKRGEELSDPQSEWANILVRDGKFVELCDVYPRGETAE